MGYFNTVAQRGVGCASCVKTANTENCNMMRQELCRYGTLLSKPYTYRSVPRTVLVWYYRERRARSVLPSTRPVPTCETTVPRRLTGGGDAVGPTTLEQPAVQQLPRIPRAAQGAEMHLAYGPVRWYSTGYRALCADLLVDQPLSGRLAPSHPLHRGWLPALYIRTRPRAGGPGFAACSARGSTTPSSSPVAGGS